MHLCMYCGSNGMVKCTWYYFYAIMYLVFVLEHNTQTPEQFCERCKQGGFLPLDPD